VLVMLAMEVTPGLQQEQSLTPINLCHNLFNGVIKWKLTQDDVVLTLKLGQASKVLDKLQTVSCSKGE